MDHVLYLSYGKDSTACLGAIKELDWPLSRVITAEVWATDTIPADLPPMVEFKATVDAFVKDRFGIEVEHFRAKQSFESGFYLTRGRTGLKTKHTGEIYGWPMTRGSWCLQQLKRPVFTSTPKEDVSYIGIAADEPNRFGQLTGTKVSPLVELGWTEADCRRWCEENGLLSPIYTTTMRGGCWFCPKQPTGQLRFLRKNYPDYWAMMLKWDKDSFVPFHPDGHTVHDYDRRFQMEDDGLIHPDDKIFRWAMLDDYLNYRLF